MQYRRPRRVSSITLSVVLVSCGAASADPPRPFLFSMGRYYATWAGRPPSYDQQVWDHMVNIGATMTGTGIAWVGGEPSPGQYDMDVFAQTDWEVDQIRARGLEPTMFLGLTPAWAALYPQLPPHRTPPAEAYVDEFMAFHQFVAERYADKITYYYFWNEPNGCSWINEGCSNGNGYDLYTLWLIRCSQAVKAGDPDAKIIAGNLDYHIGVTAGYQYIQGMYNNGAGPHIDGIAIHPYDWGGTIHWQAVIDTRNTMVANGDAGKPVWINEFGWNLTDYQTTANRLVQVLTELKKPEWSYVQMANYLVLNDGPGVENYGLMDANLNARAGYYAFQGLNKTFPTLVAFSADVTVGAPPLTVQFTDQSTVSGASSWLWEFGDGATSPLQNPQHTYTLAGQYDVKLTVTGTLGAEFLEKPDYIRVGNFPHVAFIGGQVPPTSTDAQVIQYIGSLGYFVDVFDDEPANRPSASQIAATYDIVVGSSTILSANVAGEFRNEQVPFIYWESSLNSNGREALADGPSTTVGQTQIDVIDNTHPVMDGINTGLVTVTTAGADISRCTGTVAAGARVLATVAGFNTQPTVMIAEPGDLLLDGNPAAGKRAFLFLYDTTWNVVNAAGRTILENALEWATEPPPGDFDGDRDVDLSDFGFFQICLSGTGVEQLDPVCLPARFDGDNDVDLDDFGIFQACLSGAGVPANPGCAGG